MIGLGDFRRSWRTSGSSGAGLGQDPKIGGIRLEKKVKEEERAG